MHAKLRSALSRFGGADAIATQSIVCEEFAQGPYLAAMQSGIRTCDHPDGRHQTLSLSHHAPIRKRKTAVFAVTETSWKPVWQSPRTLGRTHSRVHHD